MDNREYKTSLTIDMDLRIITSIILDCEHRLLKLHNIF
jgi:hypothetical protein